MRCPSGASSWQRSHIMTLTKRASPLIKFYQLDGTELSYVDSATYLGILIQNTLSFKDHIRNTANKCNSRLGFLRRNLRRCPQALKQTAYFSLVRSGAEYACIVWDPHYRTDKETLQKVQNRAIRWVCGKRPREEVSVSKLARDLKWAPLEQRRKIQRLTLMYKIVHGEVAVTPDQLGLVNADSRTRASHCYKFRQCSGRTGSFLNVTV